MRQPNLQLQSPPATSRHDGIGSRGAVLTSRSEGSPAVTAANAEPPIAAHRRAPRGRSVAMDKFLRRVNGSLRFTFAAIEAALTESRAERQDSNAVPPKPLARDE